MTTPPPPPGASAPMGGQPNGDDKTMAMFAHFGIILFGFLAPLIIYFIKGDSPWVKKEAAKAFNFTIVLSAVMAVLVVIYVFLGILDSDGFIALVSLCFGCIFIPVAWIVNAIFGGMNGMKANNGEETKYPFELPLLK